MENEGDFFYASVLKMLGLDGTRWWLRGGASVLLSEGLQFDSHGLHVKVSKGQDTESRTAPDVLVGTLHGSHRHQCMNV